MWCGAHYPHVPVCVCAWRRHSLAHSVTQAYIELMIFLPQAPWCYGQSVSSHPGQQQYPRPSHMQSVHTCVCRCDLLDMCKYVKLTLGVIFYHFSPHSLRQSLLRLWSLPFGLDWLTNKDLPVSGAPELGLQTGVLHLALRWVLGISSQVAIVSQQVLYFTELSSQSRQS